MKNKVNFHNLERRIEVDRRRFSYSAYIPERRSGKDRRDEIEQRRKLETDSRYLDEESDDDSDFKERY